MKCIYLLLLLIVAGCGGHELTTCKGPLFSLNPQTDQAPQPQAAR